MNNLFLKQSWFLKGLAFIVLLQLVSCGANNGFHLRKPVILADQFKTVKVAGLGRNSQFYDALKQAMLEAGGKFYQMPDKVLTASNLLIIDLKEGKRVVAYDSQRKAREYLLYLKFKYVFVNNQKKTNSKRYSLNLDRSFLYDANFVLGKTEEERQIRESLYKEAARLILLNMQYGK